jgi:hypothetical protein
MLERHQCGILKQILGVLYWYCMDCIQVDDNTLLNKTVKRLAPQNLGTSLSFQRYFMDSHASWDLTQAKRNIFLK